MSLPVLKIIDTKLIVFKNITYIEEAGLGKVIIHFIGGDKIEIKSTLDAFVEYFKLPNS